MNMKCFHYPQCLALITDVKFNFQFYYQKVNKINTSAKLYWHIMYNMNKKRLKVKNMLMII